MNTADLIAAATLGTERTVRTLQQTDGHLGHLLARLDASQPEPALLGAAALLLIYQHIGRRPATLAGVSLVPAAADQRPHCSAQAMAYLTQMLHGGLAARSLVWMRVLEEWLQLLAETAQRLPEESIPALLELGARERWLHALIIQAVGQRGRWLAQFNPAWDYAARRDDADDDTAMETIWHTGQHAARCMALKRLRTIDPPRARALLAATWAREAADERADYLCALQVGLSMADEPFLEQRLDDRAHKVRTAAARLLVCLPEARLSQRLRAAALSMLQLQGRTASSTVRRRQWQIAIHLPTTLDTALIRDGIATRPLYNTGERAWWFIQIVGKVPPQVWCDLWQKPPHELIAGLKRHTWRSTIVHGWAMAAACHGDLAWVTALLDAWCADSSTVELDWRMYGRELVDVLSDQQREFYATRALEYGHGWADRGQDHHGMTLVLLAACIHPWSPAFTRTVLNTLRRHVAKGQRSDSRWRDLFVGSARYMSLVAADEIATGWNQGVAPYAFWSSAINEVATILQFRQGMRRALRNTP
jgi:hypothetical protein